ncbi:putative beta-lysine N-acetyltransferase [Ferrimonas marina]|uniref:Putative beta-lysine N-acetyltransferase n=1 Tax=Ferrimonas marina TaxID=299255 RepID=A0A1M5S1C8_9GAMM|nr:putative beta-lysine N-acetyltransferase [Ferrimonas marina]SHH32387.1 putative beta-lysine N-acetyltransferase [Ferrimonas marina]
MNSQAVMPKNPTQADFLFDKVEQRLGATLQHGPNNDRVYLMSLGSSDPQQVLYEAHHLVDQHGYGKVFAKVRDTQSELFLSQGYRIEARIPNFYRDADALFLAFYADNDRAQATEGAHLDQVLTAATSGLSLVNKVEPDLDICRMAPSDVDAMAQLYAQVFPSYPFPITHPQFLLETMADNVAYFGGVREGKLVALASAEQCFETKTVEMTDFATAPSARGQGWAQRLLAHMEQDMEAAGHHMAYTIARAGSTGMNRTFAQRQYSMAGRLINNTQIGGQIESMNVWYKPL